ncbi:pentatricopeptide repeat-containing protein At5g16860 [Actinidia eriantha]|uniref:pentatricopeptide repeat-containing protein At5g16860 n=1 Tax=Actinidia eriantha TaxID=165200 RepID=UPI002591092F|nr:pentatricopeptide repeat-containing protein At5g16860 [Actinidia eriantha]XP_057479318.1 pentatricopeptide repeat-containing protein At5g16860 [Actinidia eriantha]XP_057479319.1 pentatricopeptide repeat-containing protein At5g16860 [Actinidia eriantha]XP_057479320.1 pentatricopeptide repeat-containing protein At5g16860 [Actinidia eriantha]XP_057479321.1 pentatricopeptide repeat-containing protein At5g16860 [Actinidia eriantha]XP_057479322.1 pentatricopeptide repeat-containing protein At5g16
MLLYSLPSKLLALVPHRLTLWASASNFSTPTVPFSPNLLKQCNTLIDVKQNHQQITVRGLADPTTITHLVASYIACDAPSHALTALERLPPSPPVVFWWNALIRRDVRLGFLGGALSLYRRMRRLGWTPDGYTYPFVLKACGELPSYRRGASVHAGACAQGFESNVFVCNAIVAMYGRCGALDDAHKVFDELSRRGIGDLVSWNSIVSAYVQNGDPRTALEVFDRMNADTDFGFCPDAVSLVNVLPACASVGACVQGRQIHGYAVRNGLFDDVFVANAIVDMYAKCGLMDEANKVFEQMEVKDVVSWNAMVSGYSQIGRCEEALSLFEKMQEGNIELNVVTWSAVIAGYAQRGHGYEALNVFRQMQLCRLEPNVVTLVSLLSGCAAVGALHQGKEIHGYAIKCTLNLDCSDPGDDLMVINGLIDMYSKCKSTEVAHTMFDSILPRKRNVVTWTVMIGGYAQQGDANDALKLFSRMLKQDNPVAPNAFTISCALMACARLAALRFGRQIHGYVLRNRYEHVMLFVANCLIDMYAKSGDVDAARIVFENMYHRNAVSWTSLMAGYGMHGRGEEALQVFVDMRKAGLVPDGVTFVVVLYALSHSGMVDQGIEYFNNMNIEFGVLPGVEHYACMVDLLGRAGRLNDAMKVIEGMPVEPSPIVWVALLSGCRTHANVELGEYAASKLLELESDYDGSYTLLSNLYANARRWKDVARIRSLMKYTSIRKRPGCSWVQGKKGTMTFYVGDRSHPLSHKIYNVLADLIHRIKAIGYVPETSFALHDVDDEEKGDLLFEHSEKLALAYGILTSPPGMPIMITKNLRVCGDCHSAITYISRIVNHEIILRDTSRFHHFKNGSCSCRGYW